MKRFWLSVAVFFIFTTPALAQDAYPRPWYIPAIQIQEESLPAPLKLVRGSDYPNVPFPGFYIYNDSRTPVYTFDECWRETKIHRYRKLHLSALRSSLSDAWPEEEFPLYRFVRGKMYKFVPARESWPLQIQNATPQRLDRFWLEMTPQQLGFAFSYPLYRHVFRQIYRLEPRPDNYPVPIDEIFRIPFFYEGKVHHLNVRVSYRLNPDYDFNQRDVYQLPAPESCWIDTTTRPVLAQPEMLYRTANQNILQRLGERESEKVLQCYRTATGLESMEQVLHLELLYDGDPVTADEKILSQHGSRALNSIHTYCRKLWNHYMVDIARDEHMVPIPPKIGLPAMNYSSLNLSRLYEKFYAGLTAIQDDFIPLMSCLNQSGLNARTPLEAVAYYWGSPEPNAFVPAATLQKRQEGKEVPWALRECRVVIETLEPLLKSGFERALGEKITWQN